MNCLDFRRVVLVNPRQPDEAARQHALECAGCREFLERQREMDAELFAALQVPPPDGLADRILVARGLRPAHRGRMWAIAATVVLAAGATMVGRTLLGGDPLGREAIEHVAEEPQSFTITHAVSNEILPVLLADQGMKAAQALGKVTYARFCPVDGRIARHLVVRTAEGAVTLLLMPEDPGGRGRAVTSRDGMTAITMPAARGSIAIVASTLDQALAFERSLRAS